VRVVDAHAQIPYTELSVAVEAGRPSLPSSFTDSEQAKGRVDLRFASVCPHTISP
jgi:hypothetical protein